MNRVFSRFQRSVVLAVFFSLAMPTAWAAKSAREQLHAEFPTQDDPKAKRPSEDVLPKSIVSFSKANFPWSEQDFYSFFGKTLTAALPELAKANEVRGERDAAYVVARLFGTADEAELEKATTAAVERIKAINEKKEATGADKQEKDYLERLLWGIQIVGVSEEATKVAKENAPPREPRFAEFKKAFDPLMKLVSEEGADFLKLKDAILKEENAEKKAALQQELKTGFRSVPNFMDRKLEDKSPSNQQIGRDLLNALTTDGKVDLFDHNGQPARVDLGGKPERYEEAWRQARKEFSSIQRPEISSEGTPKNDDPLATARFSPQPFRKVENIFVSAAAKANPSKEVKRGPDPQVETNFVKYLDQAGCIGCHSADEKNPKKRFLDENGAIVAERRGVIASFFEKAMKGEKISFENKQMNKAAASFQSEFDPKAAANKAIEDWLAQK